MSRIELLRVKLYLAIENGNKEKIQSLSEKLDKEILKHTPRFCRVNDDDDKETAGKNA